MKFEYVGESKSGKEEIFINPQIDVQKSNNKSFIWIYIIIVLLSFATLLNFSTLMTSINNYNTTSNLEETNVILEDGSSISKEDYFIKYGEYPITNGNPIIFFEDGTSMSKSSYNNLFIITLILFIGLIISQFGAIILILKRNKLGIYCYIITIILAGLTNLINLNVIGLGMGLAIAIYIFRYLQKQTNYWIK